MVENFELLAKTNWGACLGFGLELRLTIVFELIITGTYLKFVKTGHSSRYNVSRHFLVMINHDAGNKDVSERCLLSFDPMDCNVKVT